eukprot:6895344-Prymnesium_polylepis.1
MPIRLLCSARQRLHNNRLHDHVRRRGRTQRCERAAARLCGKTILFYRSDPPSAAAHVVKRSLRSILVSARMLR